VHSKAKKNKKTEVQVLNARRKELELEGRLA